MIFDRRPPDGMFDMPLGPETGETRDVETEARDVDGEGGDGG